MAAATALSLATGPALAEDGAVCDGTAFALVAGFDTPHIMLDIDGLPGNFLVDYAATQSTLWTAVRDDVASRRVRLGLPGIEAAEFLLSFDPEAVRAGLAGIIGTDVLSQMSVRLDRRAASMSSVKCDPDALRREGFRAIDQTGFSRRTRPRGTFRYRMFRSCS